ncbi:hypothetical protein [Arthrobacter sp. CP30]
MESLTCLLIDEGNARIIPYCFPIGREWWLQLFSGTIGAIIGAVVAAIAAVWVLNRTNAKQQELWEASNLAQAIRDGEAREEAQASLKKQLEAQQAGIDRSFRHQSELASLERVKEWVGALASEVYNITVAAGIDEDAMIEASAATTIATNRLRLELVGKADGFAPALNYFCQRFDADNYAVSRYYVQCELRKFTVEQPQMKFIFEQRKIVAAMRDHFIDLLGEWLSQPERRSSLEEEIKSICTNEVLCKVADDGFVDLSFQRRLLEEQYGQLGSDSGV